MDPIKVMQEWSKSYELVTTDIKLEADPGGEPSSFKFSITGFIQPKCNCREVTTVGDSAEGKRVFVPTGATYACSAGHTEQWSKSTG
jgi:hypothetical protein